jgi:hypothetical protein
MSTHKNIPGHPLTPICGALIDTSEGFRGSRAKINHREAARGKLICSMLSAREGVAGPQGTWGEVARTGKHPRLANYRPPQSSPIWCMGDENG